jgi:hypothetical protein
MKRAGCAALGCLGVLGLGFVGVGVALLERSGTGFERPEPSSDPRPDPTPRPTPNSESYLRSVGELRDFRREEEPTRYRLSYGFIDHHGRTHHVECAVDRGELERQRAAFGYDPAEISRLENARLEALVDREVARNRLRPHFRFSAKGDHYEWGWTAQGELDAEEAQRVAVESKRLGAFIENDLERELEKIRAELYRTRGIVSQNHRLSIDYEQIARQGTAPLENCFRALERTGIGYTRRQYLGLFLAFFQELTYELPPDNDGRRKIFGFWVPSDVMVRGRGDCDSKSTAFASLWRHFPERVILIVLPKHVLVGVEAPPGPGERFVRLGNRYYLLCEPAGPAKLHPGARDVAGSYEYVTIEPVAPSAR